MLIGKPGPLKSGICTADETSITVRGQDLCNEQMGVLTSTEFFLLHLTGKQASSDQVFSSIVRFFSIFSSFWACQIGVR